MMFVTADVGRLTRMNADSKSDYICGLEIVDYSFDFYFGVAKID